MRKSILPKLTSDYILQYVSPEQIFSAYLHVSLSDIDYCANERKLITAPYREDNNSSLGFLHSKGKLRAKDFGGYFWGDCFDAAAFNLGRNANNRADFGYILEDIARTFGIHKYQYGTSTNKRIIIARTKTGRPKLKIDITYRHFLPIDATYWKGKYNIGMKILKHYNVYPAMYVWFNGKLVYDFNGIDDPCYVYYLGHENDTKEYKLYYPYRKENKFFGNGNRLQGIRQIKEAPFGVITKSLKDVMSLASFGVQAIAPYSETQLLTKQQFKHVKSKWPFILTFSDYDETGVRFGTSMRNLYNTQPIYLTNGSNDTINFGVKDISDYVDKYGYEQAKVLIDSFIDNDFEMNSNFYSIINSLKHY